MMGNVTIGQLRKLVREVVAMTPGYGHTEEMIQRSVNELVPGDVDLTMLRTANEWNHSKTYFRTNKNEDSDEWEYFITKEGLAKEAVS